MAKPNPVPCWDLQPVAVCPKAVNNLSISSGATPGPVSSTSKWIVVCCLLFVVGCLLFGNWKSLISPAFLHLGVSASPRPRVSLSRRSLLTPQSHPQHNTAFFSKFDGIA